MVQTTVIFALTPQEARYAVDYLRHHPKEKVRILAPDLPAQMVLRKEGVHPDDYFIKEYFVKDYFTTGIKKYESFARKHTLSVLDKITQLYPQYKNYIYPLQNRLELAYIELINAYYFYQILEKTLNPQKYLICQRYTKSTRVKYSSYNPAASQAAVIFSFFVPQDKRETFGIRDDLDPLALRLKKLASKISHPASWWTKAQALTYRGWDQVRNYFLFKAKKIDILMYSGGRNLDCYHRLFSYLNLEDSEMSYQVIAYPQLLEEELSVRNHGISFVPLSLFEKRLDNKYLEEQMQLVSTDLRAWFDKSSANNLFDEKLDSSLKKALFLKTKQVFIEHLGNNVKQVFLAEYIIDIYQPKLVITTHDPGPGAMPFVLAGKDKGAKTLVFMHGWQDTILGIDYKSDTLASWGSYVAEWYVKKMKKVHKTVKAVGYPVFDDLFLAGEAFWQKKEAVKPLSSPIALSLLLTMYLPDTAMLSVFLDEFFKSLSSRADKYKLEIRTHPGQRTDGIGDLARFYKVNIRLNPPMDLLEFIKSSDVIVSWDTTAMFWAMIYGKPLFYCTPNWGWGTTPINKFGGAWKAENVEDIFSQIENLRNNKSLLVDLHRQQHNFLENIIGVLDGTSSEKHLMLIQDLLAKTIEIKV